MKKYILVQIRDTELSNAALHDVNGDTIFYDSEEQAWNDVNDDENPILQQQTEDPDWLFCIEINLPQ